MMGDAGNVEAARAKLGLGADQFKALRSFLDGKTFGLKIATRWKSSRAGGWRAFLVRHPYR